MTFTNNDYSKAAEEMAYNFKSYSGYVSWIPEDELPGGPEVWTSVQLPNASESEDLLVVANAQVIGLTLHRWMTGEFVNFFHAPSEEAIVYMDVPCKAAAALVRIHVDGVFTEPFKYLVQSKSYIDSAYSLLPDAESIHDELEADAKLEYLRDHFYDVVDDSVPDEEWAMALASIADEHEFDLADLEHDLWKREPGERGLWHDCMYYLATHGLLHESALEDFLRGEVKIVSGNMFGDRGFTIECLEVRTYISSLSIQELEVLTQLEYENEQAEYLAINRKLYLQVEATDAVQQLDLLIA